MGSRGGSRLAWVLCLALTLACGQEHLQQGRGPTGTGGATAKGVGGATANGAGGAAANGAGGATVAPPPRDAGGGVVRDASGVDSPTAGGAGGTVGSGRGGRPGNDGGAVDAASEGGGPRLRLLSLVVDSAPWYATQATQGIAADAQGKVYVADNAHVFMVDGATVTTYLTAAEAATAAEPGASTPGFGDLDIDPSGQLYFVTSWFSMTKGNRLTVMRSTAPHVAQLWIDVASTTMDVQKMAVIDVGLIGLISRSGFWTFSDAGGKLIYDPSSLVYTTGGCACEDLAAGTSGEFLYQPGCNGYPLVRGQADGSGASVLYPASLVGPSVIAANNFLCVARDPSGGFYFAVDDPNDGAPRLYHVTDDAQGTTGLTWIETTPSFAQASQLKRDVFAFDFCSLATAPDGTVYFQTYSQLWKVSP